MIENIFQTNRGDLGDENGDEVSSMLLLGVELLKEVEEASAAAAAAAELESRTTEELLPIGHYVVHGGSDRSTLLDQVLSSVPAAQWQAILPPVLKVRPSFFSRSLRLSGEMTRNESRHNHKRE